YRPKGEVEELRANHDCIKIFRQRVTEAGVLTDAELDAVDQEVAALIERSVQEAKAAPPCEPEDLLTDVYVSY
ncbi:thiamine pyrophosphate-dependent enzyme, partial [Neisseria sp.]